jgi:two-component system nitrate/nitrite response regulator NarL
MKLFIVSDNAKVIARWTLIAGNNQYPCEKLGQALSHVNENDLEGIGLLHLSSLSAGEVGHYLNVYSHIKWIAFSDIPTDAEGLKCLEAGCRGYINTYTTESLCTELFEVVARNDIWAGPSITKLLLNQYLSGKNTSNFDDQGSTLNDIYHRLTPREEMVMRALMTGAANKEIARDLSITERTVKAHVASILRKTNSKDRVSLIVKFSNKVA